jgi:hypothetical protein
LAAASPTYDVLVYGGAMSGIMAAVAAAREGLNVALVRGADALGGMPANGLSAADVHSTTYMGGLARLFYERIGAYYGKPIAYAYEPHVALQVALTLLSQYQVNVYLQDFAAVQSSGLLTMMRLANGAVIQAAYVIDSSYEGDLMAASGVSFRTGREASSHYGESLAGFGKAVIRTSTPAGSPPYYGVEPRPSLAIGAADEGVMAYCYRLCLSKAANRRPFPKPPNYDPAHYKLAGGFQSAFNPGTALPNDKFDLNSAPVAMSTDFIGGSWPYPNASSATRAQIVADHYQYQAGLLYFLANDASVPKAYRDSVNVYGLAADEFTGSNGWPPQLYIREARRMVGQYVMTQSDIVDGPLQLDSVGMGSYPIDSHPVRRFADAQNTVTLEGEFLPETKAGAYGYQIPYGALTPNISQSKNMLVSVCVSASRVAFCSLRVEQHYMILGEAAGVAAAIAHAQSSPVQYVPPTALKGKLAGYGAVLGPG